MPKRKKEKEGSIGIPDSLKMQKVKAFIVLCDGFTADDAILEKEELAKTLASSSNS